MKTYLYNYVPEKSDYYKVALVCDPKIQDDLLFHVGRFMFSYQSYVESEINGTKIWLCVKGLRLLKSRKAGYCNKPTFASSQEPPLLSSSLVAFSSHPII